MGQRKKRLEREVCINNPSTPGASARERRHQSRRESGRRDQTYTKRHREKLLQGSLENVSSNPVGDSVGQDPPTLRRSRSLAISREDVFTNLEIPNAAKNRRSQLIPRAKLIDRYSTKDRLQRGLSQESLYLSERSLIKRKTSLTGDYGFSELTNSGQKSFIQHAEETEEEFSNVENNFGKKCEEEIDSLDSNYQNKSSLNTLYRVSHENLPSYTDGGLSLPNYYPDSKCDTDLSFTDNVSLNETVTTNELALSNKNSPQINNLSPRNSKFRQSENQENISYDENIVFTKNTLYDKIAESNYYTKSKPRTIRGNTNYYNENDSYYSGKPRSLPNYASTVTYDSDSSLSDYDPKYYEPVEKPQEEIKEENFDTNSEVISKDNEIKEDIYESKDFPNIETNPIYDEIPLVTDINSITQEENYDSLVVEVVKPNNPIKTSIQVQGKEEDYVQKAESENSEEYKTIVSVPEEKSNSTSEEEGSPKEAKKHSHNYLKEFLETQKGSKKPLQNFLSKRISRAFNGDKNKSKKVDKESNLVENQYFSLPDITISKNLQKCEKIDRKLRKCESKLTKSPSDASTNRFIVNIGSHFDVTAHSSIPVDFELKISKIPKSQKHKKQKSVDREKTFLDAVKNLKQTLKSEKLEPKEENKKINKILINGEEIKEEDLFQRDKEVEVIIEDTIVEKMNDKEVTKEYQDKVHTMRNYWGNIINEPKEKSDPIKDETETHKCKIVGVHTKVDEVKKKFEPQEEKPVLEKQPSIVQMTKQLFEKKPVEKPVVRENRGLLENPFFERDQFESLNSNVVEIIEKKGENKKFEIKDKKSEIKKDSDLKGKKELDMKGKEIKKEIDMKGKEIKKELDVKGKEVKNSKNDLGKKTGIKTHKVITKSNSITNEPEFDHVRYRVMKSDLFQKKIFANCEKESQFDGLMQYLQDYSFQELLIDNNIVIIEPIRTNIQYVGNNKCKTRNLTQFVHNPGKPAENAGLKRHFFYHPIRVNREVNDDELPNPDTVKQVRQMFEGDLTRSQSSKNLEVLTKQTVQYRPIDPDKDRCSGTDSNSSDFGSNDNLFESIENELCCDQYVSEDILEKIRECGTSITYYGGRVLDKRTGKCTTMTKAIMDEIQNHKRRMECNCRRNSVENRGGKNVTFVDCTNDNETYQGVKFKLLKSNSCSSRLELVGTKNLAEYRNKFITKQKQLIEEHNKKTSQNQKVNKSLLNTNTKNEVKDKNVINEGIKESKTPKIIAEEMKSTKKLIQWGEMKVDKSYTGINFTKAPQKTTYDYQHFQKTPAKAKKIDEMEFEPYEIAN